MDSQTLEALAELICGDDTETTPVYRTSSELTRFFRNAGANRFQHDGSSRKWWTLGALQACTPQELTNVILRLASRKEYRGDPALTRKALSALNQIVAIEGYKVVLVKGAQARLEKGDVE